MSQQTTARLKTVKVRARGEDFRIVQLQGSLLVCSKEHGNCCCGWTDKGRAPVNTALYGAEWERRKLRNKLHLSFTGCPGPCAVRNNALLILLGRAIWLKDLNDEALISTIFDYVESMMEAGHVLPPPTALRDHVYERYLPPPEDRYEPLVEDAETGAARPGLPDGRRPGHGATQAGVRAAARSTSVRPRVKRPSSASRLYTWSARTPVSLLFFGDGLRRLITEHLHSKRVHQPWRRAWLDAPRSATTCLPPTHGAQQRVRR